MTITIQDLSHLSEHLDVVEMLAKWSQSSMLVAIVRVLKLAAGDDVILQGLADFLNWTQLFAADHTTLLSEEPALPLCLERERKGIEQWRACIRAA